MKKNNIVLKTILKYLPLYLMTLVLLYILQYAESLSGLFVGEILGTFNGDSSLLPSYLQKFIDYSSIKSTVISLALEYIIISSIALVVNVVSRTMRAYHFELLNLSLSREYYKHILDIPRSEYVKRSTGDIMQRNTEDCKRVARIFRRSLYEVFKMLFVIITLTIRIFNISKTIFVISLIALIICISFSLYFGYFKIKDKEIESSKYYSELNATLQQSITNYSLVKSFVNEDYEYEKFKNINDKKEKNNFYINNLHCRYWLISDLITSSYTVICYIMCAVLFFNGSLSLAAVSAIVILCSKYLNNSTTLVDHITTFIKTFVSIKRLNEYFNIENEYVDDGVIDRVIDGNIEFKNVSLAYDNGEALHDLNFSLNKGETLGIVGKSGSGKTSIINLLSRLDDYTGSVKIDGIELKDYKKKCIRNNLGIVLQDAYIFSKSVKDNILILMDNDRVDLDMYLKRVSLDEDINKFDKGLETVVGERGVTLSGGQRQRVSLLRTMIKNKSILILDDTLSAVDNIVAKNIKKTIDKQKATTIIISHNLLNVKDADKIIVLDNGRIVDIGKHEELISREGFYCNVWNIQQKLEEVK